MNTTVTAPTWGFLTRDATTAPGDMFAEPTPGLNHEAVQIALLTTESTDIFKHVVVNTVSDDFDDADRELITGLLHKSRPHHLISFSLSYVEGSTAVAVPVLMSHCLNEIACAHAICRYSGGWDDSQPMTVRLNGHEVRVFHELDGELWRCRAEV